VADALLIEQWRGGREGLRLAIGGSVNGPRLCRALLDHPRINLCKSAPEPGTPWVLANGLQSRTDPRARYLELTALPGQVELCSHPAPPPLPILANGYVAPCPNGLVVGSTYEYTPWSPAEARAANLARWPDLGRHRGSFRASRTISSDRLPVVGALFDIAGTPIDNVYVVTGFGSAGMAGAPLAGEMVAAEIAGEFAPVTRHIAAALSSQRFRERQQRRGGRLGAQVD
jgi:tRNA 5-methylaminomethyl-2-thiouridine biosynthesis bifunctional protein